MGIVATPIPVVDLTSLSEKERDVLRLRFVRDFSLSEVAESLGITVKTVKNIQTIALRKARNGQAAPPQVRQRHRFVTLPPAV
jgi:DNA-directed RNA polymerase specialized sigma24 family protein